MKRKMSRHPGVINSGESSLEVLENGSYFRADAVYIGGEARS